MFLFKLIIKNLLFENNKNKLKKWDVQNVLKKKKQQK